MREKNVEQKVVREVTRAGGLALKFISPSYNGVPDRLILLPGGRMAFVEVKAPGKKPRTLQLARHEQLRRLGFRVYVIADPEQIDGFIEEVTRDGVPTARLSATGD